MQRDQLGDQPILENPLLTLAEEEAGTNFPVVEDTVIHSVLVESCSG